MLAGAASAKEFRELARTGRGARLLDALRARPLRRPPARADPGDGHGRRRHRPRCASGTLVLGNDYKHPVVLATRGRDARPALRRPARARHRRGLDDGRLREGRDPARPARRAHRPARRSRSRSSRACWPTVRSRSTASTTGDRSRRSAEAGAAAAPAVHHRRRRPKILAVAAREAEIVGINANLRGGVGDHDDAAPLADRGRDRPEARPAARGRRRPVRRPRDPVARRLRALHRRSRSIAEAMAASFGSRPRRRSRRRSCSSGTLDEMIDDCSARRERWQMSYVVVPESRRRWSSSRRPSQRLAGT